MRPIDADELLWCYEKRMDFERHRNHAYLKGVRDCIKELEYQPTIDSISIDTEQEEHEISYQEYFRVLQKMWANKVLTDQQYHNIIEKLFIYWEHKND